MCDCILHKQFLFLFEVFWPHVAAQVTFSPDGRWIISASFDKSGEPRKCPAEPLPCQGLLH